MWAFLSNYRDAGLLLLRVGLGVIIIWAYGWSKINNGVADWQSTGANMKYVGITFWPVMWGLLIALIETLGAILLIIGFAFRPVCLLLLLVMILASIREYAQAAGSLMAAAHWLELSVVFLSLMFIGPGKYSVDRN